MTTRRGEPIEQDEFIEAIWQRAGEAMALGKGPDLVEVAPRGWFSRLLWPLMRYGVIRRRL